MARVKSVRRLSLLFVGEIEALLSCVFFEGDQASRVACDYFGEGGLLFFCDVFELHGIFFFGFLLGAGGGFSTFTDTTHPNTL